jgi:hypothetical protein
VPAFFITGKDKGKLGYFWEHVFLKAKSGPNLGGVVNPDTGLAILDSERQKLTYLDFGDKLKLSEILTRPPGGTTRYSALWQADRKRIQRMAPIEFVGRYMRRWFDFAIADELHQLAGDTAQGNGLGVLGRAAKRLIALTGMLMGGYAHDLFNIFYRMEPHAMAGEGFAYGGQGRRDFQEQYGVLETIEKVRIEDNACSRSAKKMIQVLRKPGASPLLFGKFLMNTTAFLSLEDIAGTGLGRTSDAWHSREAARRRVLNARRPQQGRFLSRNTAIYKKPFTVALKVNAAGEELRMPRQSRPGLPDHRPSKGGSGYWPKA